MRHQNCQRIFRFPRNSPARPSNSDATALRLESGREINNFGALTPCSDGASPLPVNMTIERIPVATDEARALVGELDAALALEYPPEQQHGLSIDAIFQPHIRFFLVRLAGEAVGCGGVALFADFAEVKRMFVRPSARRRGVAKALLARLEAEALEAGLASLRLETGERQTAAIDLYAAAGFRRCGSFGQYAAMGPYATATSVFFEKPVAARPNLEDASPAGARGRA